MLIRITDFRRRCNQLNMPIYDFEVGKLNKDYLRILSDLAFYEQRLPGHIKLFHQNMCAHWNAEMFEWATILIVYHACFVCLYGPQMNLIKLGRIGREVSSINEVLKEIGNVRPSVPQNLVNFFEEAERMDDVLSKWESSIGFAESLRHAGLATDLMMVFLMEKKNNHGLVSERESPVSVKRYVSLIRD